MQNLKQSGMIALAVAGVLAVSPGLAAPQPSAPTGAQGSMIEAGQCTVSVDRSGEAGTFSVARHVRGGGDCSCLVTTGPEGQSSDTDSRVSAIVEERSCAGSPSINLARAPLAADGASGLRGEGSAGSLVIGAFALAAAIFGIIEVADDDRTSP